MGVYFGEDVDQSIALFQLEQDKKERDRIFEQEILPAFKKLSQYHYYKMPVARNVEVMNDCVAHLCEQLHKFDTAKASRGFPYFNMIAKNFFTQKLKYEKKQISNDQYSVSLSDYHNQKGNVDSTFVVEFRDKIEHDEFSEIFVEKLSKWRDFFRKEQERKVIDGLLIIFKDSENIICKKKAIFFYLKEITGLNSKQIATNLNKIKKKFISLKDKYERGEI
jgi:hypothetical protein